MRASTELPQALPVIRLRGHHLLCLHGFRGLGYSPAFVENMERVKGLLLCSPSGEIELAASPDDICKACPNLVGENCLHEESVARKDTAVLDALSLPPGTRIPAAHAFAKARKVFSSRLEEICSSCEWLQLGYCRDGLEQGPFLAAAGLPEDINENS